jgi:DNA-binding transcriptional ArsR family regulator
MSKRNSQTVADVFFALGDATRLQVVRKLIGGAEMSATQIAYGAKVTRQAIVKHLQVLQKAGLVRPEKHGREVLYHLTEASIADAREFLNEIAASWDRAIARLRRIVEDSE